MADLKITQLQTLTSLAAEDLFPVIDDPNGTPVNKKITVKNVFTNTPNTSVNGTLTVSSDSVIVTTSQTPATAGATGTTGEIAWDSDYIYVCVATNTWKRVAIATW
jgi:hypothetical protein